uniref:protein-serine/threonine phosphatase n=1 Tax=Kalanchoe fedtschenkoi TaxID=63787 RepID=A0A7N0U9J3_KALFE
MTMAAAGAASALFRWFSKMVEDDEVGACQKTMSLGSVSCGEAMEQAGRRMSPSCCSGLSCEFSATEEAESAGSDGAEHEEVPRGVVDRRRNEAAAGWRLKYGVVSIIGRRREMEDAVAVQKRFVKSLTERGRSSGGGVGDYDFFAVFDGHGGSNVARFCRERLHEVVAEEVAASAGGRVVNWEQVMAGSFGKVDEEVNCGEMATDKMKTIGSTAVVAVVGEEEVVVANCGDSRAVICRSGVAVALSTDHKPNRPDERERVEAAGGRVINWNGFRVLGVLATSRSIGDHYLKPFIISEPEVAVCERTSKDEFLILASDGLWDVITNEVACQVTRQCLYGRLKRRSLDKDSNPDPNSPSSQDKLGNATVSRATEAAASLAELAIARGSKDNISVVVIELRRRK